MTPAEKRDRRQARHEMQALFRQRVKHRFGLILRPNQIEREVNLLVDRAIKGEVPMPAENAPIGLTPEAAAEMALARETKLPDIAV